MVVPPRYYSHWEPGDGVRNEQAIQRFFLRLADRVTALLDQGTFPLVLGGDCSILLGNMLALRRRGRYGLIFIDAHSDLRHPGNSDAVGSAAGEDLAPVTGRGDVLANLEGRRPLVLDGDVVAIGQHRPPRRLLDPLRRRCAGPRGVARARHPRTRWDRFHHLSELLRALLADGRARGIEITIFDPDLDEGGEPAAELTRYICDAFTDEPKGD